MNLEELLKVDNRDLTNKQVTAKMVVLVNLYHSIDLRAGSDRDKKEAKLVIEKEVRRLKRFVGDVLEKNLPFYLRNEEAWNAAKNSYLG